MAKPLPINTSVAPRAASPLWIIALFIALTQSMAGIAAIATDGTTRMIFAIFAVTFPVVVLALFVWLLLRHPANLYSPGQYTAETTIETYVRALGRESRDAASQLRQTLSAVAAAALSEPTGSDARSVAVTGILEDLTERSIVTVDRSVLLPGSPPAEVPVTTHTTVDELLDSIYFHLADVVPPRTYGQEWVLADEQMTQLTEIGRTWAEEHGMRRDVRPIVEVGIQPGARIVAVKP